MARTFLVEHAGELSALESAAIGRYLVSREREVARLRRIDRRALARRGRRHLPADPRAGRRPAVGRPRAGAALGPPAVGRSASRSRQARPGMIDGEDRALADAGLRDPEPIRPVASRGSRRRSPPRPAGSGRGSGLIRCRSAATAAGSAARIARTSRDPVARQGPVEHRRGEHLDQVRRGAADRDDLGRACASGRADDHRRAPRRASPRPRRTSAGSWLTKRSVSRADPSCRPDARGRWVGSTTQNSELPPPTSMTRVSWVTGMPSVTPMIVRIRLLLVRQDVQRRAGCGDDLLDDGGGIGRPADRFGAEEGDVGRAEAARPCPRSGRGWRSARRGRATQEAALGDGRAEPEEDRLVDQRLEPMAGHDGGHEMDRVGPDVDRRADDRAGRGGGVNGRLGRDGVRRECRREPAAAGRRDLRAGDRVVDRVRRRA